MDDEAFRDADDPDDSDEQMRSLNAPIAPVAPISEQDAAALGTPEPEKRRRGRPPGLGKVPGSGRQKETPNWSAAGVRNDLLRIDGIGELRRIIEGKPMRVSGSTGKSFDAYPSIDQRIRAVEVWLKKVSPDLQSMAVTGADHETPLEIEHSSRDVSRAVLDLLRSAKIEGEPPLVDHDPSEPPMNGGEPARGRGVGSAGTYLDPTTGEWTTHDRVAGRTRSSAPQSGFSHDEAGRVRVSDLSDAELQQTLRDRGMLSTHFPSKGEVPGERTAEEAIEENKRREHPHLAWPSTPSGASTHLTKGEKPPANFSGAMPASKWVPGQEVPVTGCAGLLEYQLTGGDGRMKFFLVDKHGMRHRPFLGTLAEAEAALREFEKTHGGNTK